jgi:hypothetical protein
MMTTLTARKPEKGGGEARARRRTVQLAAIGLEAEFSVILDGKPAKPEEVFRSPTRIIRAPMMHRTGRSYHMPTGGAVYFDTGVIEIATPVIELEKGCAARAGRSLWESIRYLRTELDAWEAKNGHTVHLAGFSTHYNVSFEMCESERGPARTVERLALLLTHIIAMPVMLLAANRRSTGVGVRPRGNRVEITADFTPDAALMIAAATLIVGISREVMTWPTYDLDALGTRGFPLVRDFTPEPHSSRKGWVARFSSYSVNPFLADVNAPIWKTRNGPRRSLRSIARLITSYFWESIAAIGDERSLRLISTIMDGRTPSLLELDDRPAAYDSVGRLCTWENLFPVRALPRSRYERVFIRAISGRKLYLDGDWLTPTGMRGWSHVVFRRDRDGTRHAFSLDFLLRHLDGWEVGPRAERRIKKTLRERLDRREKER